MTSPTSATTQAVVGFHAGWALVFRKDDDGIADRKADPLRLTHTSYQAEIKVDGDNTLRGATFDIAVDGMLDRDYDAIAAGQYVHVEIRLGWWDLQAGFVGSALGAVGAPLPGGLSGGDNDGLHPVLEGRVLSVERAHGDFTYRARFSGIDASYHRMQCRPPRLDTKLLPRTVVGYATGLCQKDSKVRVPVHGEGQDTAIDGELDISASGSVVSALKDLARLAHGGDPRFEVPMFLRAGELHVGRWTRPVKGGRSWELTSATGLVESRPVVERDQDAVPLGSPFASPTVRRFDLTLFGRPDIGVGDMVRADLPRPSPAGMTGTLAHSPLGPLGDAVTGAAHALRATPSANLEDYGVVGFHHRLSPSEAFVTRLTVERRVEDDRPAVGPRSGSGDEATRFAAALAEQRRRTALERRAHEVGLVRGQDVAPAFRDGHDVAAQTLAVDEGLADAPSPNVPSRADPATTPTRLVDKPYLSPYAFGGTGLVVPHYPGMRVVSLHYREECQNAVVAGALWENGSAPRSHLGDWWLSLPTNLAGTADEGESAENPAAARRPSGPASHDLINGLGNRVIQVRGLRISIGEALMKHAGSRPDDAASEHVVIEHAAANARISIDSAGTIEISTDGDLTLAANKITLRTKTTVEVV
ncbi:hypothetical protein [Streptomyces sp. DASNCL29]|uniref:hypothetical protein n=1 Tax=Streptomyces sp. DASNCL29 TaxID=2583819 RepID=UPI00110F96B2|nr:hypothetical protein [Streptomyces sp. DASNCL29]TMV00044.1 hypothetical protein FGK60_21845 [Streptomyces sp. DASNCL29]